MNRRDALAALLALPAITAIEVATPQPDEVLVVETPTLLSQDEIERLGQQLQQIWPGRKVVVMEGGMKLRVVRQA